MSAYTLGLSYRWEIEFTPENPRVPTAAPLEFTGTYREACDYADTNHPDYQCDQIIFSRKGVEAWNG